MAYRFVCSHCGKSFELDTPAAKECPFCYWSSTVKREDESISGKKKGQAASKFSQPVRDSGAERDASGRDLGYLFRTVFIIAVLAGVAAAGSWGYKKLVASSSQKREPFTIKFQKTEKHFLKSPAVISGVAALSPEEKEALYKEITLPAERVPDASEQEVLGRAVRLETGWVEKVPSANWTLEQYTRMIEDQERFYKMPFPRSYKKKLQDLFKTKYLAGVEAFTKGDLLAARDLWVESLAFPLYSEDLRKHRAVALTMLRPFINDTLAKIRAMNQGLVDKGKRAQEEALSAAYQKLSDLIARKQWDEALAAIASITPQVTQLQQSTKVRETPPSYPLSFGSIDQDIQKALMDLMTTNPSSLADLQPLQQDLVEKKEVLETFTEEYMKNATMAYRNAMALIHEQKWGEAIQGFESMAGPQALQEDAARKVAILKKIDPLSGSLKNDNKNTGSLDSSGKTS